MAGTLHPSLERAVAMAMRSDVIKRGFERAPHRSLLRATGVVRRPEDFDRPFNAVVKS